MIAIPNMRKPKSCWECFNADCNHWGEHGYDNTADCPLIEIADDVWENEKYKLIRMTEEARINKAMAERRNDD